MKMMLRVDTELDSPEMLIHIIEDFYENNNTSSTSKKQTTLTDNNTNVKKYFCNNPECKKEITKAVVAYCLHPENKERFKGKVYCIKCQEAQ